MSQKKKTLFEGQKKAGDENKGDENDEINRVPQDGSHEGDNKDVDGSEEEEKDEYVVEAIRDHRVKHKRLQFLLKWEGWPEETNTWEDFEHLSCRELFNDYRTKVIKDNGVDILTQLALSQYNIDNPATLPDGKPLVEKEELLKIGFGEPKDVKKQKRMQNNFHQSGANNNQNENNQDEKDKGENNQDDTNKKYDGKNQEKHKIKSKKKKEHKKKYKEEMSEKKHKHKHKNKKKPFVIPSFEVICPDFQTANPLLKIIDAIVDDEKVAYKVKRRGLPCEIVSSDVLRDTYPESLYVFLNDLLTREKLPEI